MLLTLMETSEVAFDGFFVMFGVPASAEEVAT